MDDRRVVVRRYEGGDAAATWAVFHAAVHRTARRDYAQEQVEAWAPPQLDEAAWHARRAAAHTVVACEDDAVVGFCDHTDAGELDMLYVHPRAGGREVARLLVETVVREATAAGLATLHVRASLTALPVFLHLGFTAHGSRYPEVRGQVLENVAMSLDLTARGDGLSRPGH